MTLESTSAIADAPDSDLYEGQKRALIAELAYAYAEERGFEGGNPTEDWLRAERKIEQKLNGGQVN